MVFCKHVRFPWFGEEVLGFGTQYIVAILAFYLLRISYIYVNQNRIHSQYAKVYCLYIYIYIYIYIPRLQICNITRVLND